ncbi:cystathionine beta-lyase [Klebsiella quasipneumoniae]|uniref:cystathionine beta-lyase n=1 Tax=Klebsiella quasipneumoniae TaxID=1463165 RepID=UPI00109CF5B3|nr:cystathionine beta-lyase [Klebsiella quasipneumoniae]QNC77680.1 cystathionine beta-lyase [Klebsiella quasipneumoniae]QXA82682.1 cystathionine beta-lyase [Klebsiella quasipneumoniae]UDC14121.1 cystathionine beta-lyase [Klebsiella quasipneumoniae subsp. similipneumoniae]VGO91305.1 Cystathionine beta-lyase MetC [Klebsiella quasipneumoniae subsp. similipneumoniae]HDS8822064.1 cystathionine beta-lyase [Klebsiella quasipneumoniae subsp. similipneumoniae]
MADKHLDTALVNAGRSKKYTQGSVNSVIQRASSLVFDTVEAKKHATRNRANGELFYGRRGTLTHFSLQEAMCELEGGAGCALFPCGAAAVANTILAFVEQGDHVLMTNTAYEPSQDFCTKILAKLGVTTSWFDPLIGADIAQLIRPETRMVFLESPGSITMEVHDVPAIVAAVRQVAPEAIIMIDNTWAAGILFKALDFGIDISIQAGTKYLIGHSDAMVGTAVANARCWPQLRENAYLMGQMLDADTAYMTSRGLRTLGVRLRQHHESSLRIAEWLAQHPQVARVNHPALPGSKGHEFWKRDFTGSSGLFSFVLNKRLNDAELAEYLDNFSLFSMAYSWGGFESLILANQPEQIAHIRPDAEVDFSGTLIRLHIGLENVDDLQADLAAGFARIV